MGSKESGRGEFTVPADCRESATGSKGRRRDTRGFQPAHDPTRSGCAKVCLTPSHFVRDRGLNLAAPLRAIAGQDSLLRASSLREVSRESAALGGADPSQAGRTLG